MLLQTWQPPHPRETQLLVDVEEEDGQRHDKDAHRRQEADGLRGDWQEEGEGEGTYNDTLIRPHKQTVWIHARTHTHTHTVRMIHVIHTDRTSDTLVLVLTWEIAQEQSQCKSEPAAQFVNQQHVMSRFSLNLFFYCFS